MGVQGLWDLLAPCGRRCSVDVLDRKRLAVDASIWLIQFIKAMRDSTTGEMMQNAPQYGLFRRLCKLLFLHIRPLLVFDGGTPAIKRRTVARRREFRQRQESSLRRTAEKLLLNQMRGRHLLHGVVSDSDPHKGADAASKGFGDRTASSSKGPTRSNSTRADQSPEPTFDQFNGDELPFGESWRTGEGGQIDSGGFSADIAGSVHGLGKRDDDSWEDPAGKDESLPTGGASGGVHGIGSGMTYSDVLAAAAVKDGGQRLLNGDVGASALTRAALGSVIVPRAADLDEEAVARLPPALQFEILDEIKLSERTRRRDELVRTQHSATSFSYAQLENYVEMSKVASRVDKLRDSLNDKAQARKRIMGDADREYMLLRKHDAPSKGIALGPEHSDTSAEWYEGEHDWDENADVPVSIGAGEGQAADHDTSKLVAIHQAQNGAACQSPHARAEVVNLVDEDADIARAIALSYEDAATARRKEGKRPMAQEGHLQEAETPDYSGAGGFIVDATGGSNSDEEDDVLALAKAASLLPHPVPCPAEAVHARAATSCFPGVAVDLTLEHRGVQLESTKPAMLGVQATRSSEDASPNAPLACKDMHVEYRLDDLSDSEDDLFANDAFVVRHVGGPGSKREHPISLCDGELEGGVGQGSVDVPYVLDEEAEEEEGFEGVGERTGDHLRSDSDGEEHFREADEIDLPRSSTLDDVVRHDVTASSAHESGNDLVHPRSSAWRMEQKMRMMRAFRGARAEDDKQLATSPPPTCVVEQAGGQNRPTPSPADVALVSRHSPSQSLSSLQPSQQQPRFDKDSAEGRDVEDDSPLDAAAPIAPPEHAGVTTASDADEENTNAPQRTALAQETGSGSCDEDSDIEVPDSSISRALAAGSQATSSRMTLTPQTSSSEHPAEHARPRHVNNHSGPSGTAAELPANLPPLQRPPARFTAMPLPLVPTEREVPRASARTRAEMLSDLESEASMLRELQRKQQRDAEMVTDEHLEDAKTLLALFGVPFIVAPMEAEAQCAALEMCGLVDGVVTEDNDVLLFGARHVYKNLFAESRNIEYYQMDDVEGELGIGREQLIDLAQLLGSDYTDGVHGVGIVNAMEVVTNFKDAGGLKAFAEWAKKWESDYTSGSKDDNEDGGDAVGQTGAELRLRAYKNRHRKTRRNWVFPDHFPSAQVADAYLNPAVDRFDNDGCEWGRPDLQGLRQFCLHKFGWDQQKADEALLPVMRAFEDTLAQTRISNYFHFDYRFARYSSERLRKAVGGAQTAPGAGAEASTASPSSRKARKAIARRGDNKTGGYSRGKPRSLARASESSPARGSAEPNVEEVEPGAGFAASTQPGSSSTGSVIDAIQSSSPVRKEKFAPVGRGAKRQRAREGAPASTHDANPLESDMATNTAATAIVADSCHEKEARSAKRSKVAVAVPRTRVGVLSPPMLSKSSGQKHDLARALARRLGLSPSPGPNAAVACAPTAAESSFGDTAVGDLSEADSS